MAKLIFAFAALTASVLLASFLLSNTMRPDADLIAFKTWMARNGKHYTTEFEFTYRLGVFKRNAIYVAEHNARHAAGLETFDLEMNLFADMEINEFVDKYTMKNFKVTSKCTGNQAPVDNLPATVDWATKGISYNLFRCRHPHQESRSVRIVLGFLHHRIP